MEEGEHLEMYGGLIEEHYMETVMEMLAHSQYESMFSSTALVRRRSL